MKYCICCGKDIVGKPVELNPPDPKTALCRPCNTAQKATPAASPAESKVEELMANLERSVADAKAARQRKLEADAAASGPKDDDRA